MKQSMELIVNVVEIQLHELEPQSERGVLTVRTLNTILSIKMIFKLTALGDQR